MSESRQLGEFTWPDVATRARPVVALPIGSCEQHGPHLPLDTDTRIAIALADALAQRNPRVLVGPPLTITASGEHQGFAGTLSIGLVAMQTVLVELVRSADWCAGVVLVNGHGGNAVAVQQATSQLRSEGRRVLAWWPRLAAADAHAGRTETSLMLAIAPNLVGATRQPGRVEPISELLADLQRDGIVAVSPNGVLGDPVGATAADGAALFATLADDLDTRVQAWIADALHD